MNWKKLLSFFLYTAEEMAKREAAAAAMSMPAWYDVAVAREPHVGYTAEFRNVERGRAGYRTLHIPVDQAFFADL